MSDPQDAKSVADREAAEWHVRLGERPVAAATLAAFRDWRATSANADAYQRFEILWRTSASLSTDADIQALTRDTLQRTRRPHARPSRTVMAASAALLTAVALAAFMSLWLPARTVYATDVGVQRLVRLEDGTQIRLDTATRLKVRFTEGERRVQLDAGQALFMVAHDAARPFRVDAGQTEVTALGTTFDVRRDPQGARVTLVSGSVAVRDERSRTPREWRLEPGQQLRTAGVNANPRAVDAALETSWSQGRLIFRNTPLRDAVAEVNRYLPDKIVLAAGASERVAVNGVFTAGDRDAFVAAASDLLGLTAHPQGDGSVRLTAPSVGG